MKSMFFKKVVCASALLSVLSSANLSLAQENNFEYTVKELPTGREYYKVNDRNSLVYGIRKFEEEEGGGLIGIISGKLDLFLERGNGRVLPIVKDLSGSFAAFN